MPSEEVWSISRTFFRSAMRVFVEIDRGVLLRKNNLKLVTGRTSSNRSRKISEEPFASLNMAASFGHSAK